MQNWHFVIYGSVQIDGDSSTMNILPYNISSIIRISDFVNKNMPYMIAVLSLDRNLGDKIIKNATTATIHLTIQKFNKINDTDTPMYLPYLDEDLSLWVTNDINYNKEMDYAGDDIDGKTEDKFQTYRIGLIPKIDIESNKVVANSSLQNTNMMNIVASYMTNLHLLLEPFDHNPSETQLIIPPKDTLYQTIKFLNNISVFYDTKFLFFIDEPYCTYLISRSGKGIQKSDDLYNDIYIELLKTTDQNALSPGMLQDDQNSRFYVNINVLDSRYTIDHDTAKIINKIQAIINPNKTNTLSGLSAIQNIANDINNITNSITSAISSISSTFKNLPNLLESIKDQINTNLDNMTRFIIPNKDQIVADAIIIIQSTQEPDPNNPNQTGPTLTPDEKKQLILSLNNNNDSANSSYTQVQNVNTDYDTLKNSTNELVYNSQYSSNSISGTTYVNTQDGASAVSKVISSISSDSSLLQSNTNSTISKYNALTQTTQSYIGNIKNIINDLSELPGMSSNVTAINSVFTDAQTYLNGVNNSLTDFNKYPQLTMGISQTLEPMKDKLNSIITTDIKSQYTSIMMNLTSYNTSVTNSLKDITNLSSGLSTLNFNFNDLTSISNDFNAIKDLTGIGKLGISKFETILRVGENTANELIKDGSSLILKINNDNPNMVKNIASEIQNRINNLTVNKYDLDPSVFTPNKKYTVKNYDAHSDKDGTFILNRKVETYYNEDNTFTCNTLLDLFKVVDNN